MVGGEQIWWMRRDFFSKLFNLCRAVWENWSFFIDQCRLMIGSFWSVSSIWWQHEYFSAVIVWLGSRRFKVVRIDPVLTPISPASSRTYTNLPDFLDGCLAPTSLSTLSIVSPFWNSWDHSCSRSSFPYKRKLTALLDIQQLLFYFHRQICDL